MSENRGFSYIFKFIVSYTIYTIFIIFFKTSINTIIQPLITKRISLENKKSIQNFCIKLINRYSISILFACKFRKTRNLLPKNSIINKMNYSFVIGSFLRNNNCLLFFFIFYRINIYKFRLVNKFLVCFKRIKQFHIIHLLNTL